MNRFLLSMVLISGVITVSIATAQNSESQAQPDVSQVPLAQPVPAQPVPAQPAEAQPAEAQPAAARGRGRGAAPPQSRVTPTLEQLKTIQSKLDQLNAVVKSLKDEKADDSLIVEAEVSAHYVGLTLRFPEEFFDQQAINRCVSVLDSGLRRAQEIKEGKPSWVDSTGRISRAFRSRVDGTPQPYRVMIPNSYDKSKPSALYIYLHGRGDTDLGLGWIGGQARAANNEAAGVSRGPNYIQLQVFGRANNSFRYPGEVDVFEALETVKKNYNIDPDRIILAGFSMGGAGSWQIGLHHPDMFCGLEIDAGVLGNRRSMDGLTAVQKAASSHYGIMIDHAVNVLEVPLVGYAGENDAQLAASTGVREQLVKEGYGFDHPSQFFWSSNDIRALFLAIPNQGHSHATGETLRLINAFNAENFQRGRVVPDHIRFVTYTTRYNKSYWITVDGMQQHFDRAYVDATRDASKTNYSVKTSNVSRLLLSETSTAQKISIDADVLTVRPATDILLVQKNGHWQTANSADNSGLRKQHNIQGPINDAFLDAFICVTPSGPSNHPLIEQRSQEELARFERLMAKEYRGAARTKSDSQISSQDVADSNLILFGNPESNKVIAQIANQLPIKWSKGNIVVGNKTYSAADHVGVLIYPNPLNPKRYVVINTGLVVGGGGAGYGDFAVLKMTKKEGELITTEIVENGVFNENWDLPAHNKGSLYSLFLFHEAN